MSANTTSSSQPVSAWEWSQAGLLVLNLAWTTLCLGGYRPETLVVTSGLTGALLLVHLAERVLVGKPRPAFHPAGWLLLPFIAYAAANVGWISPTKWLGWMDWWAWAQMAAIFWVVLNGIRSRGPRVAIFWSLIALALIAVLLGCYQRFVDPSWMMMGRTQALQFRGRASGSFGIPNSLAGLLLLLLPVVLALVFRRRAAATERVWWSWVAVVLLFGLMLTISRGAWIALALAVVIWPLFRTGGSWQRRTGAAATALVVVVTVMTLVLEFSPAARERFENIRRDAGELSRPILWHAAWNLFREAPVSGTGAGSYNVRFETYRPEQFTPEPQWAHNDYLNTLSDYGIAGFLLLFGAVAVIAVKCAVRRYDPGRQEGHWLDRRQTVTALAVGLLAFSFQLFVEFHFKIAALALACATIAGMVVGRRWAGPAAVVATPAMRAVSGAAAVAVGIVVAFAIIPLLQAEALRYGARQAIDEIVTSGAELDQELIEHARGEFEAAVRLWPCHAQAWADLADARIRSGGGGYQDNVAIGKDAESAADAAIRLCPVHYEFWVRRGVSRDMQGRWYEAGDDFIRAIGLAPANSLAWYQQAYHLSRIPNQRAMAMAAAAFSLRLDPGNRSALALCQQLAIIPKAP